MAANLVAVLFEGEHTADSMLATLRELEKRGAIKIVDAAVASRPASGERVFLGGVNTGDTSPHTALPTGAGSASDAEIKQTRDRRGRAVLAGGGIGLLIGAILGGPIGGLVVGGLIGGLRDKGIDNGFIQDVAKEMRPDSSAIFLLSEGGDAEQVLAELKAYKGRVLSTTLPEALDKQVRDALRDET